MRMNGMLKLIVPTMIVLGFTLLIAGWKLRRLRGRATMVGLVASVVIALLGMLWFLTSLAYAVVNLMPLIVVAAAALSAALCAATLGAAQSADAARLRLAEHGVEVG